MEVELSQGQSYGGGDYLAILSQSPEATVRAILAHFKMPLDATITLKSKVFSLLPLNTPLAIADLLRNYYELAKPATKRGLSLALKYTSNDVAKRKLAVWIQDEQRFEADITAKGTSMFELLRQWHAIDMPFPAFLSLLHPLSVRQCSISSSPLKILQPVRSLTALSQTKMTAQYRSTGLPQHTSPVLDRATERTSLPVQPRSRLSAYHWMQRSYPCLCFALGIGSPHSEVS